MWWWLIGIPTILQIVVLASYMKVALSFSRIGENDKLTYDVYSFLGLLRFHAEVPIFQFSGLRDGVELEAEMTSGNAEREIDEFRENITAGNAIRFYRNIRKLTGHAFGFSQWLSNTMSNIKCTHFRWSTQIGVGDAAATAITAGAVWGIKTSIVHYLARKISMETKPCLEVHPEFNRNLFATEISYVMKIRHYYAIVAVVLLLFRIMKVRGGMKLWAGTVYQTYSTWKNKRKAKMA